MHLLHAEAECERQAHLEKDGDEKGERANGGEKDEEYEENEGHVAAGEQARVGSNGQHKEQCEAHGCKLCHEPGQPKHRVLEAHALEGAAEALVLLCDNVDKQYLHGGNPGRDQVDRRDRRHLPAHFHESLMERMTSH